jgi:hypothetical protein
MFLELLVSRFKGELALKSITGIYLDGYFLVLLLLVVCLGVKIRVLDAAGTCLVLAVYFEVALVGYLPLLVRDYMLLKLWW